MGANKFPSMKATKLRSILKSEFGYRVVPKRGKGGHHILISDDYPQITWGFHNGTEVTPRGVRQVLVDQVGLTLNEAREVLGLNG